jgi:hypothetical protein
VPAPSLLRAPLAAVALAALVLLPACNQPTPTEYNDSTEENFLEGCEAQGESQGIRAVRDYCECTYEAITEEIEFERFKEVNEDLSEDPGPLPDDFQELAAGCTQ